MVRPAHFGWNPETAASNTFQTRPSCLGPALHEFDQVVEALRAAGVHVLVVQDSDDEVRPDAVFSNNWLSTHDDGTIFTYPMASPLRRRENRPEVMWELAEHYRVDRFDSLADHEDDERFLEGTGSLVLDRVHKIAYACESPRTDVRLAEEWAGLMGYQLVTFQAEIDGKAVYHTNVIMSVGSSSAVLCLESVKAQDRERVLGSLGATGHDVVDISIAEARAFCGNVLELAGGVLAGSWSLGPDEDNEYRKRLAPYYSQIVGPQLPTIWSGGGGGIRCMLCEIFLEPR